MAKRCPKCAREFSDHDFYQSKSGRLSSYCKGCMKGYAIKYYAENTAQYRRKQKRRYHNKKLQKEILCLREELETVRAMNSLAVYKVETYEKGCSPIEQFDMFQKPQKQSLAKGSFKAMNLANLSSTALDATDTSVPIISTCRTAPTEVGARNALGKTIIKGLRYLAGGWRSRKS